MCLLACCQCPANLLHSATRALVRFATPGRENHGPSVSSDRCRRGGGKTVFPQDDASWERRTQVALELGYFSPAKETFRNNYDQRLVFGSVSAPIAVGIEIDKPVFRDMDVTLNVRRINHRLKSNDEFSFALMPATLGRRYVVVTGAQGRASWKPDFGARAEFYWARFGRTQ